MLNVYKVFSWLHLQALKPITLASVFFLSFSHQTKSLCLQKELDHALFSALTSPSTRIYFIIVEVDRYISSFLMSKASQGNVFYVLTCFF